MRGRAMRVYGTMSGRAMKLWHDDMESQEGVWHNEGRATRVYGTMRCVCWGSMELYITMKVGGLSVYGIMRGRARKV